MSQRFGRNQRRRAREAIQAAQEEVHALRYALDVNNALIQEQGRKLREAEAFAREVARMVGREAVIAGVPTQFDAGMPRDEALKYGIRTTPPRQFDNWIDAADVMSVQAVRYEILRLLDVRTIRDIMSQQMHVRVQLADLTTGYSMSEMALSRMTAREIAQRIAPEIAQHLAEQLKKQYR